MQFDRDFRELLACLAVHDVRYLVVGGYAVAAHGHPRYTGDLDLWVWTAAENAQSLLTSIDGVEFQACFDRRVEITVDGAQVPFIALEDLRRNKAASGRPQDLADLAALDE